MNSSRNKVSKHSAGKKPKPEKNNLVLVRFKPDSFDRFVSRQIFKVLQSEGFELKLNFCKTINLDNRLARKHLNLKNDKLRILGSKIELWRQEHELPIKKTTLSYGREYLKWAVRYVVSDNCTVAVFAYHSNPYKDLAELVGDAQPANSPTGTIRGDYGDGDSYDRALKERRALNDLLDFSRNEKETRRLIKLYFGKDASLELYKREKPIRKNRANRKRLNKPSIKFI